MFFFFVSNIKDVKNNLVFFVYSIFLKYRVFYVVFNYSIRVNKKEIFVGLFRLLWF